ncbi:hypothetical protein AOZ06_09435 [Kibdelosporangium phytohabitans]|uniref:Uncharacterized protein n=1 Tax=Kibdelosporangium phytohabitans TaxID=860235 RepID=A0A0N9HXY9_9PSEU|nr:hypothetical protein AOZ06_09435 [Kibdelosporangium phytohabitans]
MLGLTYRAYSAAPMTFNLWACTFRIPPVYRLLQVNAPQLPSIEQLATTMFPFRWPPSSPPDLIPMLLPCALRAQLRRLVISVGIESGGADRRGAHAGGDLVDCHVLAQRWVNLPEFRGSGVSPWIWTMTQSTAR